MMSLSHIQMKLISFAPLLKTLCAPTTCYQHGIMQRNRFSYSSRTEREFLAAHTGGGVELSKDDQTGIATIKLNHPEIKNGLSGHMMVRLSDITEELSEWKAGKGVILHGANGNFCSGGDLNLVRDVFNSTDGAKLCKYMQATLNRLFNLPLISVAFIEGVALGGGAELTTACDFRIMTADAKIGFVQSRMGVTTGWGGGARLVQLIGRTKALQLLSSAKVLNVIDALELGLIQHVIKEPDSALSEATKWLQKHTAGDPLVVQVTKKVVVNGCGGIDSDTINNERYLFASLWGGPAHGKAMESNIKHK